MDRTRRAQVAAVALSVLLLAACSNDPSVYPHGDQRFQNPDDGSVLRTVAIYVLLPALILGVIAAAAWLPGVVRSKRYRPQQGWDAAPVWFAGPSGDAVEAVEQARPGGVTRGGNGGDW